ncbi:class I SAM-dependent methyltransferase [Pullulanibacillus camelliae]|nr:class I SAM-dependent methyltransferase [Pullulanibacillus camelliae]
MWYQTVNQLKTLLMNANITYCFDQDTALALQNVPLQPSCIDVMIQWDQLELAHTLFIDEEKTSIIKQAMKGFFTTRLNGIECHIHCLYQSVVATDPDRLQVEQAGEAFYVKSLYSFLNQKQTKSKMRQVIIEHLDKEQHRINEHNRSIWSESAYDAWIQRFGAPEKVADNIHQNPYRFLGSLIEDIGVLSGKKVINLLGSNGLKALSLVALGAEATVVDISEDNARYAREVAASAHLKLNYIVSDVLELPEEQLTGSYDVVVMERGILHYFLYLNPLFAVIRQLLKPGGILVLQEFHPVSVKLITSKGKKHKVTGNYFDHSMKRVPVAFSKHLQSAGQPLEVYEKNWTFGEILTAIAEEELIIKRVEEKPNIKISDSGLPKTFTVIAEKR